MRITFIILGAAVAAFFAYWFLYPGIKYNKSLIFGKYRKLRKYILAQWMHETGRQTSRVWKENNNGFGMKHPVKRKTLSKGADFNNYAIYSNGSNSVNDLLLWLDYNNSPLEFDNVEAYSAFLKRKGYYEDSYDNYTNCLKYYLKEM